MSKINNKILKTTILTLFSVFIISCESQEGEFDPPNKTNIKSGNAEKIKSDGTAMKVLKKSDKMAKIWSEDSILVNINGVDLDQSGVNKLGANSSKWIITYFSPKKNVGENAYTITFSGNGSVTWVESNSSYQDKNSIANFSIDSDKAFKTATTDGLVAGTIYSADLSKNDKGLTWVVGSKKDPKASYEIKKVDGISGTSIK
ncbi:MAG: hypothetical protein U0457_20575 [Candidatus Sericytochromatia bacterium]